MRARASIAFLVTGCIVCLVSTAPADPPAAFDLARHVQLPPGFVIEKIAGPPVIKHPLHVTFDNEGRCYVTEMAGVNRNRQELEKELPNGIKRLIDTNNDGVYDQASSFADKMTFPAGILWHQGAIYCTSFPYLWKLKDNNNDGVADERIPLVGTFGSIGNAADLHGPQLGPDGWLYFCDGRNGHDVTLGDGTKLKGKASGLYRCKTDGSSLERVFAGGMDNPVEVAFTPAGEALVCTNLVLNSPRHDALLLGLEGGVYPYWMQAVRELTWTGQYLPIMGELGWVAVSSVIRKEDGRWGPEYTGKFFTAEFNTHAVRQHTITRQGGGFIMKSEPFLTCSHPDFHPTQILNRPDGSMILVDTGGWFRNGCPTSQIAKPEVTGGVYRIHKKIPEPYRDAPPSTLDQLWALGHALSIKVDPAAQSAIRSHLHDADLDIQLTALRFVAQYRDMDATDEVMKLLGHVHPAIRRDAATALGRLKHAEAVSPLITALEKADDPYLEHALIFALIRIQQPAATSRGLSHSSSRVQRGVMLALDQLPDGLHWDQVAPLLQTDDGRLKQSALEVVARRPLWISDLADYVDRELNRKQIEPAQLQGIKNLIVALAPQSRMQQLIADRLACEDTPGNVRYMLLEAISQADVAKWPAVWTGPLDQFLAENKYDHELMLQAILAAQAAGKLTFTKPLRAMAENAERPLHVRLAAASLALQDGQPVPTGLYAQMLHGCRQEQDPALRLAAARAISAASLNHEQRNDLLKLLAHAGPLELPLLLSPFEQNFNGTDAGALLQSLESSPGLPAVPLERLQKVCKQVPLEYQSRVDALLKRGRPDLATQQARLQQLKPILTGGDIKKGRELFTGAKAVCSTCHRVGNEGGLIGPQLSTIGAIRTRADLLESILYPSSSLARGYETVVVVTRSGKTLTGVITRETADALVLTDSQRSELKVLRTDIEQMTASPVSVMPAGVDQTVSSEELRDLLAYLESLKK